MTVAAHVLDTARLTLRLLDRLGLRFERMVVPPDGPGELCLYETPPPDAGYPFHDC